MLVLLDRNGRFQARIEGPITGNVLLRRAQYRASDRPEEIVRSLLVGKVANQRSVLMRALRDYGEEYSEENRATIRMVADRLARITRRIELSDETLDTLRGSDGEAANLYFSVFGHLIRSPDAEMGWNGRSRRPPARRGKAFRDYGQCVSSRSSKSRWTRHNGPSSRPAWKNQTGTR